jgi:hypothetical protein
MDNLENYLKRIFIVEIENQFINECCSYFQRKISPIVEREFEILKSMKPLKRDHNKA